MMSTLPAAGFNSKGGQGGTARECLAGEERASTPPSLRKYRRSTQLEPGRRFVHYGIADDIEGMNLNSKVFGGFTERGTNTAADLINHSRPSELERINQLKAERIYKSTTREQLGKTVDRGNKLPSKFVEGGQPFGQGGTRTQTQVAKDVIFPSYDEAQEKGGEIYVRSHGSFAPGQQRDRHYNWPVDPQSTRFGCKGDTIAFGGASKNISDVLKYADEKPSALSVKRVEDFRNMGDILGQSRNLGQGSSERSLDQVYGKPSTNPKKTHWGVGDIMRGNYKQEDLKPDNDLGKSIMPGFRNITTETRAFGCPSIRSDLPNAQASVRRSLADSQNYGDDPTARDLINPPAFSEFNIPQDATFAHRDLPYLQKLFADIGYDLHPNIFKAIYEETAYYHPGQVSIHNFRVYLNQFLDAADNGAAEEWCRDRGVRT